MTEFYTRLCAKRGDNKELQACVKEVVDELENVGKDDKPGLLLGKIQSGKTMGFLGVICEAFDRRYDMAIVLTKGTRTLAQQTVRRIGRDYADFIAEEEILLFDIKSAPDQLTRSELRRKLVIVSKKEVNNLKRIEDFFAHYPETHNKRVLIIDDEADMASVRFTRKKGDEDYDQGKIAQKLDAIRGKIKELSFLQVTATPYSLYLQPDHYEQGAGKELFRPKKPAFTVLLPIHSAYVGGDDYFGGHPSTDPRYYLYERVALEEHDALRKADGRSIRKDRVWTTNNISILRHSVATFLLSVVVRRIQQAEADEKPKKYAMVMHNDTQRSSHGWQQLVINIIKEAFEEAAESDDPRLKKAVHEAYDDLQKSVLADKGKMPTFDAAYDGVKALISDGELLIQKVNSDVEVASILDPETAELRLRTPANMFIGGSILDRGITVPNLIAFYYGRNPKRMQADTVLQHSRMYGARPKADLAVTRFYTSQEVYDRLSEINAVDNVLRQSLESGSNEDDIIFIQQDPQRLVIPCAPNKIAKSNVTVLNKSDFLLPTGFDTDAAGRLGKAVAKIDGMPPKACIDTEKFSRIPVEFAVTIVEAIQPTLTFPEDADFDWEAMIGLLHYYASKSSGEVLLGAATGRKIDRFASGDKSGRSIVGTKLRQVALAAATNLPALLLLKQEAGPELNWRAGPFWWPVFVSPSQTRPCIFAGKKSR